MIETKGLFCALHSDWASHFFVTPKAGEPVDRSRLTQVERAPKELGVQMIPAYSPQARGRSKRSFGAWQDRLPQELRLTGITAVGEANGFSGSATSADSMSSSWWRRRREGQPFASAPGGIWISSRTDVTLKLHSGLAQPDVILAQVHAHCSPSVVLEQQPQ
ncbi:MAG: hypothetical protein HY858_05370 [Candidatus Solibacter usitatus]|nr:hypothetical protein [Candidatus Solibacter usitatus]